MVPSRAIDASVAELLAADTNNLSQAANALKVFPIKAAFVPGPDLDTALLSKADFDGSTALLVGLNDQDTYFDPVSGQYKIKLIEPAGGWTWECTGTTNLPQTIHGYLVTKNDGTTLIGSDLISPTVLLQNTGDGFSLPPILINVPAQLPN